MTLGGRIVPVERPRVRRADGGGEVTLASYRHFADRDPLDRVVLGRMLAGVSCRRYPRTQEPVGETVELEARSVSRSALSRRFSERPWVRRKLRSAWAEPNHGRALASLQALARQLEVSHPGAASSLREGLEETLTLSRLGVSARSRRCSPRRTRSSR